MPVDLCKTMTEECLSLMFDEHTKALKAAGLLKDEPEKTGPKFGQSAETPGAANILQQSVSQPVQVKAAIHVDHFPGGEA